MYHILIFLSMMAVWLVLSGQFDAFHITLGVISAAFVTAFSGHMHFLRRGRSLRERAVDTVRIAGYLCWLLWEIIIANLHVLYLALHPRGNSLMEPQVVRFKTRLKGDFARYILANSITLTPGTVTISIEGDEFLVHAISRKTAAATPGTMEERVAAAFDRDGAN